MRNEKLGDEYGSVIKSSSGQGYIIEEAPQNPAGDFHKFHSDFCSMSKEKRTT